MSNATIKTANARIAKERDDALKLVRKLGYELDDAVEYVSKLRGALIRAGVPIPDPPSHNRAALATLLAGTVGGLL